MKPKKISQKDRQRDLFRAALDNIIDPSHGLVKLSKVVEWNRLDDFFGSTYCSDNGRPGVSTRLMVALHYLKYTRNLSDEDVVATWVENPYWQYFSGMKWFKHELPINPSSMTRWRKRIGEAGAEELLKETIKAGLKLKAVKSFQLKRVNVDTTVQEKEIRFPTDARLYDRARQRLVDFAKERGIKLRQNYNRKSKQMLYWQSRYSHARQMKRAKASTRKLRNYLGRVLRDIERNCSKPDRQLQSLIDIGTRIYHQKQKDKNKVYSVHAPEVECISKGKAHKRYEFGCKVSVAATSKGGWFLGAMAVHGNPYDGHTLAQAISSTETNTGVAVTDAYVDKGYRGHNYVGEAMVHISGSSPRKLTRTTKKRRRRRSAIEPKIGHLKRENRLGRCFLAGLTGDAVNVVLAAAGSNLRKLLAALAAAPLGSAWWAALLLRSFPRPPFAAWPLAIPTAAL